MCLGTELAKEHPSTGVKRILVDWAKSEGQYQYASMLVGQVAPGVCFLVIPYSNIVFQSHCEFSLADGKYIEFAGRANKNS